MNWAGWRSGEVHAALAMDLARHDICIRASMILNQIPGLRTAGRKDPRLAKQDINLRFVSNVEFMLGSDSHPELKTVQRKHTRLGGLRIIQALNRYICDTSDLGAFREAGLPYLFFPVGTGSMTTPSRTRRMASATAKWP